MLASSPKKKSPSPKTQTHFKHAEYPVVAVRIAGEDIQEDHKSVLKRHLLHLEHFKGVSAAFRLQGFRTPKDLAAQRAQSQNLLDFEPSPSTPLLTSSTPRIPSPPNLSPTAQDGL